MVVVVFHNQRSVVKSFKVPDVDVVAALMSNESALTRMTDSTQKPWSDLMLVLDGCVEVVLVGSYCDGVVYVVYCCACRVVAYEAMLRGAMWDGVCNVWE